MKTTLHVYPLTNHLPALTRRKVHLGQRVRVSTYEKNKKKLMTMIGGIHAVR